MIDLDRAVTFVRQTGNPLDKLRLRRTLGDPVSPAEAEAVLAGYQFPDDSWDYNTAEEQAERIGSLGGTIHVGIRAAFENGSLPARIIGGAALPNCALALDGGQVGAGQLPGDRPFETRRGLERRATWKPD
jgi:hypothetical protein